MPTYAIRVRVPSPNTRGGHILTVVRGVKTNKLNCFALDQTTVRFAHPFPNQVVADEALQSIRGIEQIPRWCVEFIVKD